MLNSLSSKRVLLAEDDEQVSLLMRMHLAREGLEVTFCRNGEGAARELRSGHYDLAVLDWMLPEISGIELCKQFHSQLPILMVTARTETSDIVLGLELGARDYLTKPFEVPIFVARVRALLRSTPKPTEDTLSNGLLVIKVPQVQVFCSGVEIALTTTEFKLLLTLMRNAGRVLTREQVLAMTQGTGVTVVGRTIDTHILSIRKKLGPCSPLIETIRGIGYRIKA